jgi:hypothetical protein
VLGSAGLRVSQRPLGPQRPQRREGLELDGRVGRTVNDVSRDLEPSLLVFSAASDGRAQPVVEPLRGLAARQCLALCGAAAATGLL